MSPTPEVCLDGVRRVHRVGETNVLAINEVSLSIYPGDFVAIKGRSGSGKSSLLNILGLLDRPDAGRMLLRGVNPEMMSEADLARMRSCHIGFVFQSYQLMPEMTALENVALGGLYSGVPFAKRLQQASELLVRVGLSDRMSHLPAQLSGGQQQRVAVARALFNPGTILLADEPTGSLDSTSSGELLELFASLNRSGVTIVVVTHDDFVAAHASRVIEMLDGRILSDSAPAPKPFSTDEVVDFNVVRAPWFRDWSGLLVDSMMLAFQMMTRRLVRTGLTIFGNIVGIASIIVIIAVGEGARQSVDRTLSSLGANLVVVMTDESELPAGAPRPTGFTLEEIEAVQSLPQVEVAVLQDPRNGTVSAGRISADTQITATLPSLPSVNDWGVARGEFFNDNDMRRLAAVAVLGQRAAEKLFGNDDPLGKEIQISDNIFDVIGVMSKKGANPSGFDLDDVVLVPFDTARARLGRDGHAEFLMAKVSDGDRVEEAALKIQAELNSGRGQEEVIARSLSSIIDAQLKARDTLTLLLASLALISLVVGSVGITNITLVSIIERTREIGLRRALGASERNIMMMVLAETGMISLIGGFVGVVVGVGIVLIMRSFGLPAQAVFEAPAVAAIISLVLGIAAGVYPARRAARLDPIRALASL